MRFLAILCATSLTFMLVSCMSAIVVKVHSVDMNLVRKTPDYAYMLRKAELMTYSSMLNGNYFAQLKSVMLDKTRKGLLDDPNHFPAVDIPQAIENVSPKIDEKILNYAAATQAVRSALNDVIQNPDPTKQAALQSVYQSALGAKQASLLALVSFVDELDVEANTKIDIKASATNAIAALTSTYGQSIIEDDLAPLITRLPEKYWNRYTATFYPGSLNTDASSVHKAKLNVAKVHTYCGNSDIAVKMDGPGNFVIKGIREDADEAFRTSFKVLGQGVKYLAYASGIPVKGLSGDTAASRDTSVLSEITDLEKRRTQASMLEQDYEELTDTFLKILASKRKDLVSKDDVKRKQAIAAIKAAYGYYKSQLQTN